MVYRGPFRSHWYKDDIDINIAGADMESERVAGPPVRWDQLLLSHSFCLGTSISAAARSRWVKPGTRYARLVTLTWATRTRLWYVCGRETKTWRGDWSGNARQCREDQVIWRNRVGPGGGIVESVVRRKKQEEIDLLIVECWRRNKKEPGSS